MRDSCFSMESEGILMVWRARSLSEVTLGVDCMMNNMEGRGSGSNYCRPWWLKIFILAAQKVRKERLEMRISRDRLWREDSISREFDELCTDEVPGDILGLRRLFDMEQFPGLVEHEAWTAIWEFFIERPLLMLFALRFYRRERQTPKPLCERNFNLGRPRNHIGATSCGATSWLTSSNCISALYASGPEKRLHHEVPQNIPMWLEDYD